MGGGMDEFMGEIREFKRTTLEKLEKIEGKVDVLQAFHFKVLGAASVISVIASALFQYLTKH